MPCTQVAPYIYTSVNLLHGLDWPSQGLFLSPEGILGLSSCPVAKDDDIAIQVGKGSNESHLPFLDYCRWTSFVINKVLLCISKYSCTEFEMNTHTCVCACAPNSPTCATIHCVWSGWYTLLLWREFSEVVCLGKLDGCIHILSERFPLVGESR